MSLLIDPLGSFDLVDRDEANDCLVRWGHQHGANNRPRFCVPIDFGLRRKGNLVAVAMADTLIRPTCDFTRNDAFELSRLCAAEPRISRLMLRMWTELGYPEIVRTWGTPWAISYQDATKHTGNLYRFDGWVRLRFTQGGSDPRARESTESARKRWIWGWHSDEQLRAERKAFEKKRLDDIEQEKAARKQRRAA
jgi:antitoxin VapB